MDARELRIGNLIRFDETDAVFEVTEIDGKGLGVRNDEEETWIEIYTFSGIDLTEEWLLKFGFKYRGDGFYILNIPNKFKVYISISIINDCYQLCQNGHGYSVDLKQVHKIQNLYFALTGKEL